MFNVFSSQIKLYFHPQRDFNHSYADFERYSKGVDLEIHRTYLIILLVSLVNIFLIDFLISLCWLEYR